MTRWRVWQRAGVFVAVVVLAGSALAACGGGDDDDAADGTTTEATSGSTGGATGGDAAAGEEAFAATCASCHGQDGKGLPNLGKDLTTSQFVADSTDDELIAFVKVGRAASDPENTTGVAMPPLGGNPALSEQDVADIVAYIRTIEE